ncbi:cytidine deaminase [Ruminococcus sp.]|uniref:cytidine deaminase n=1 Tax=Ruminococcus sp. TaxID=41978 RepID=UPI0025F14B0C|nr:cytidine deaminase [Ruminococcus sp.]MBQ8966945.1 cytidine deaminase [Ruminococcus sp.]
MIFYEISEEDKELIKLALSKLETNYDREKYNHTVGAAVRCKNGRIYSGVDCNGIHGSCAEYITIGIAVSAGERDFDTIVAVHRDHPNKLISPCGNCRQMLIEYCPDIKVILNDNENNVVKVGIKDLLPFACL